LKEYTLEKHLKDVELGHLKEESTGQANTKTFAVRRAKITSLN